MRHVIVKLWLGKSEEQKTRLAPIMAKNVVAIAKCEEKSVSTAIEAIKPEDWAEMALIGQKMTDVAFAR